MTNKRDTVKLFTFSFEIDAPNIISCAPKIFSLTFFHTAISQFLMADISFNIACKELKIAQISQLSTFAFSSYIRPRLL